MERVGYVSVGLCRSMSHNKEVRIIFYIRSEAMRKSAMCVVFLIGCNMVWATNIAPLATPSADSALAGAQFAVENFIDGSLDTYWASTDATSTHWYRLMWTEDVLIDQVRIDFVYPTVPVGTWARTWKDFNIKVLNAGATDPSNAANWTTIAPVTGNSSWPYILDLATSVQTKGLQIDIFSNYGFPYAMAYELSVQGTVVPEPVTLMMLLVGSIGLIRRNRK